MKSYRTAIIGIGALGFGLVEEFSKHPNIELIGVCDRNKERVAECLRKFPGIKGYHDYEVLLQEDDVDLVYIAVPPAAHYRAAMDVLNYKKHIILEKPLANSLAEAVELEQFACSQGVVHAINYPLNYVNAVKKLSETIENGELGKIRRIDLYMKFPVWPRAWQENAWISTRESGGFVFEVSGHFIQLIHRFFGDIEANFSKLEFHDDPSLCERGILAHMSLRDGTPIFFNGISGTAGLEEQHLVMTLYGERGTASYQDLLKLKVGRIGEEFLEVDLEPDRTFWEEMITNVISRIEGSGGEIYDFHDGRRVQEILEHLRGGK